MALPILLYPEARKILTSICDPVAPGEKATDVVIELIQSVRDSAISAAGLAAPQIGICKRIILVWMAEREEWQVMINPTFHPVGDFIVSEEGCLSLPGLFVPVARQEKGTVTYFTENGSYVAESLEGFDARCVQHEIDHLNGVLIIHPTRLSSVRRRIALDKYAKMRGLRMKA